MKTSLCIFLFVCIFFKSYSQFSNYSFGDVTREEIKMTDCPFEPGVKAMIIAEKCELVNELGAPYHVTRINRRIKILNKEGLSYGNFELEYMNRYTEITYFQATVYNLENDVIVNEKTKSDDAIITKIDKNHSQFTVSLPNVKVGSVIDIFYKQKDDNMMPLQPWYFQSEIPCGWSEYIPKIQKKASYTYYFTDFLPFAVNTVQDPSQGAETKGGYTINRFAVENAPSYHFNEPYVIRIQDQLSKVDPVFNSYNQNSFWGNGVKPITWTEVNENLLKNPFLGKVINKGKFLRDPLKGILVNCTNFEDSLRKVYEYIRQTVKCDGYRNIYASNLESVLNQKSGNTGEINLLLITALREAGFDCHPLLLTTSEASPPSQTDPRRNDVNFVVAAVFRDTIHYLLDASNREIAFNSLSSRCLNGDGFLVSDHFHDHWIPLLRNECFKTQTNILYPWDPEKTDTVFVEKKSYSFAANKLRYTLMEEGEDEYFKSRKLAFQNYNITNPEYTGLKETDSSFTEKFRYALRLPDYNSAENYFIKAIPIDMFKGNPFDAAKRDFRIDFEAPTFQNIDVTIQMPDGMSIVTVPESIDYSDLGNSLVFNFSVNVSANEREIKVHSAIQIKGCSYSKLDYEKFRAFFTEIIKKQGAFIEVKKEKK